MRGADAWMIETPPPPVFAKALNATTTEPELPEHKGSGPFRGSPQLWWVQVRHPYRQSQQHTNNRQQAAAVYTFLRAPTKKKPTI